MSKVITAHQYLLSLTDRGLEFLWQWAGVKRRYLFTAVFALWQGGYIVESLLKGGTVGPWWLYLIVAGLGLQNWIMWRQEVKYEKASELDVLNGVLIIVRESRVRFGLMIFVWVLGIACVTMSVLSGVVGPDSLPKALASLVGDLSFVLYHYTYDAVAPMGPRKKIKLPKLSLPKVEVLTPAPAYGGAWG